MEDLGIEAYACKDKLGYFFFNLRIGAGLILIGSRTYNTKRECLTIAAIEILKLEIQADLLVQELISSIVT